MSRALVTGAAGFIGSHVVDHLLARGLEVTAVDNLSGGHHENVNKDVLWRPANISSSAAVEWLFEEHQYDYVYHLGAYAAEGLSHFIRGYNYQTNLLASVNLINQAVLHKVKRFVFTSSVAVYGHGNARAFNEQDIPRPIDPYGISKYAVELDLAAAAKQFDLTYTILRPHNVYGPRQNISDPYRNVVGIFIRQCLNGEPMTIFGNGSQKRQFSYIDRVAKSIAVAPFVNSRGYSTMNKIFNVGDNDPSYIDMNELARLAAETCGTECVVRYLPSRNEAHQVHCEHKTISNSYGQDYPPGVSLREGLTRTVAYIREHGIPEPTFFREEIEVPVNMPPSWEKIAAKVPH